MERRGQARDMLGIQNSMNYIPPPTSQESPVKLPLAPLVATSADRRGNATVPTRRGSSIFSPTQILDHQNHPPPHLRHQVSTPPPPQPLGQNEHTTDPDPAPNSAATAGGSSNSKAPAAQPQGSPPPPPPPAAATAIVEAAAANCSDTSSIIFRECLRNHAAGIGGHVVDGCGEFMASGEEGTPEAMRCAACDCHRNFHRKEVKGEPPQQPYVYYPYNPNTHRPNPLHHTLNATPRDHQQNHHHKPSTQATMVNFGGNPVGAAAESSSEDLNMFHSGSGGHASMQPSISGSKKRSRTKFSQEQKDRMHEFAEKLDWRIQKQDDQQVQQFCSEVGVKRQSFKVWMHNNKQAMKKKQI